MLDDVDTRFQGQRQSRPADAVRGHRNTGAMGLIHDGLNLIARKKMRQPLRAFHRAGNVDFDQIRARRKILSHRLADRVNAAEGIADVAMAMRGPDAAGGDDEAGSDNRPDCDRFSALDVEKTLVPHAPGCGDAGVQIHGHGLYRPNREFGDAVRHSEEIVVERRVKREMVVTVDEPRQEGLPRAVHQIVRVMSALSGVRSCRADPATLNQ